MGMNMATSAIVRNPVLLGLALSERARYAALAALTLVGALVLYNVDPRNPSSYPVCPFLGLTGCYCPGCGTLRALHQLLHGNLLAAMGYNPLTVLSLPFIAYSLAASALRAFALPAPRPVFVPSKLIWGLFAAVIAFWALRNVPYEPFVLLAP